MSHELMCDRCGYWYVDEAAGEDGPRCHGRDGIWMDGWKLPCDDDEPYEPDDHEEEW